MKKTNNLWNQLLVNVVQGTSSRGTCMFSVLEAGNAKEQVIIA